jgi:uncharacterized RDD family membrane protein YckC
MSHGGSDWYPADDTGYERPAPSGYPPSPRPAGRYNDGGPHYGRHAQPPPRQEASGSWYPEDPDQQQPQGGSLDSSRYFDELEQEDYGSARGFVGDIPVADPLRRIGSALIDAGLCVVLPALVIAVFDISNGTEVLLLLGAVVANVCLYAEITGGQTVGKQLLGTQAARVIVTRSGKFALVKRGPIVSLVRAGIHFFDAMFFYIAIPLIILTPQHQSFGDLLTRTVVIKPTVIRPLPRPPQDSKTAGF